MGALESMQASVLHSNPIAAQRRGDQSVSAPYATSAARIRLQGSP